MTTDDKTLDAIGRAALEHDIILAEEPRTGTRVSACSCGGWSAYDGVPYLKHIIERGALLMSEQVNSIVISVKAAAEHRAEARVQAAKAMAEANIRDVEEQAGLEKQAAVAAALELAVQVLKRHGAGQKHLHEKQQYEITRHPLEREDCVAIAAAEIFPLANTDALSKVKAQAVEAALDRVWELMEDGLESFQAMEKVKEEVNG